MSIEHTGTRFVTIDELDRCLKLSRWHKIVLDRSLVETIPGYVRTVTLLRELDVLVEFEPYGLDEAGVYFRGRYESLASAIEALEAYLCLPLERWRDFNCYPEEPADLSGIAPAGDEALKQLLLENKFDLPQGANYKLSTDDYWMQWVAKKVNWHSAEGTLYWNSKKEVVAFLQQVKPEEVYGVGFFCSTFEGVGLAANTFEHHRTSFADDLDKGRRFEARYRWDIGNWKYPSGLLTGEERQAFDEEWKPFQELLKMMDDEGQQPLEKMCARVLKRLLAAGVFAECVRLEGFTVLGPDDPENAILKKRKKVERQIGWKRPKGN